MNRSLDRTATSQTGGEFFLERAEDAPLCLPRCRPQERKKIQLSDRNLSIIGACARSNKGSHDRAGRSSRYFRKAHTSSNCLFVRSHKGRCSAAASLKDASTTSKKRGRLHSRNWTLHGFFSLKCTTSDRIQVTTANRRARP